jgi:hypothetical protein
LDSDTQLHKQLQEWCDSSAWRCGLIHPWIILRLKQEVVHDTNRNPTQRNPLLPGSLCILVSVACCCRCQNRDTSCYVTLLRVPVACCCGCQRRTNTAHSQLHSQRLTLWGNASTSASHSWSHALQQCLPTCSSHQQGPAGLCHPRPPTLMLCCREQRLCRGAHNLLG